MSSSERLTNSAAVLAEFVARSSRLGVDLAPHSVEKLHQLCRLIDAYNRHTNLVSRSDLSTLLAEHVLDSLTLVPLISKRLSGAGATLIDIGSGAGFPVLVLAVVLDRLNVACTESVGKKARFLVKACDALALGDRVRVLNDRAEILARRQDLRATFDFATARAVGSLQLIAELALPFLRTGGVLLAQKSARQANQEAQEARVLLLKLGGALSGMVAPDEAALGRQMTVVLIEKEHETPPEYPRRGGKLTRRKERSC